MSAPLYIRGSSETSIVLFHKPLLFFGFIFFSLASVQTAVAIEITSEMGVSIIDLQSLELEDAKDFCNEEPQLVQCDTIKMRIFEEKQEAKQQAKNLKKEILLARKNNKTRSHDYRVLTANYQ